MVESIGGPLRRPLGRGFVNESGGASVSGRVDGLSEWFAE